MPCFSCLGLASALSWTIEDGFTGSDIDLVLVHPEATAALDVGTTAATENRKG